MEIETFKNILKIFKTEQIDLNLFWWEPLLNKEIIQYLLEDDFTLPENVYVLSVNTNGIFLDEIAHKLAEKFNTKIRFDLSLDGNKENHDFYRKKLSGEGTYDQIIKNLELFPDKSIFTINFCISPFTSDKIYDGIMSLKELWFTKIKTIFLYEYEWTDTHLKNLILECIKLKKIKWWTVDISLFHEKEEEKDECKNDFLENYTFLPSGKVLPCPVWISKSAGKVPNIEAIYITDPQQKREYVTEKVFWNSKLSGMMEQSSICESIQWWQFKKNQKKIQALIGKFF